MSIINWLAETRLYRFWTVQENTICIPYCTWRSLPLFQIHPTLTPSFSQLLSAASSLSFSLLWFVPRPYTDQAHQAAQKLLLNLRNSSSETTAGSSQSPARWGQVHRWTTTSPEARTTWCSDTKCRNWTNELSVYIKTEKRNTKHLIRMSTRSLNKHTHYAHTSYTLSTHM